MTPKDYLKNIIRPPKHHGWPHVDYKGEPSMKAWLFCSICGPRYRKYLNEKQRLTNQGEKILLLGNSKM